MDELSDEQLMTRYGRGDAKAFEVLLQRHYQPVFNYLVRHCGNRATAEELLQDVFTRVIRGAREYEQRAKFTTWLYKIARNIIIDHSRKQKFRRHASLDAPAGGEDDGARMIDRVKDEDPRGAGDRRLADTQMKQKLAGALEKMNADQREVFELRHFQHLKFEQIAEVTRVSTNTVKSRMRYALEFLRQELSEFAGPV